MSGASGAETGPLLAPLNLVVVAAILVTVGFIDPMLGVGGAVVVGLCWALLGPIPAFAVGECVLAALGAQPPLVIAGLQLPLGAILLTASMDGPAPGREAAGTAVALLVVGALTAGAWLWGGSVGGAVLVSLGAVALSLYAVYRYEAVWLWSVSTEASGQ